MQSYIKLSDYAKLKSITYRTAWNHYSKNLIKGVFTDESGHICVPIPNNDSNTNCVIYARVSSNDRKESLKNQQGRLEEYASLKGLTIIKNMIL